jgi:transcription antitermination factor NusG
MTSLIRCAAFVLAFAICSRFAFSQVPERMVGTVASLALDKAEIEVKGQDGKAITVHLVPDTILQRVAPGEKSLKNAEAIPVSAIAVGDKVLINSDPATGTARRLVVMSATAISKKEEADRAAWTTRGITGIVVAKAGDDLTLRLRNMQGETQAHVLVSKNTGFRKYSPDSIKFADAKVSSLAEIKVGDQLRARGDKSEDGLKVTADEVVFGTFVTKAGTVTSIDAERKTVAIKELNTNKAFNVKLTADSQLKQMPNFAMFGGPGGPGGSRGGMGGPPSGPPAGGPGPGGPPGAEGGGQRPPMMMGGGRPPDMAQMIERMPSVSLEAVKVGDTVVMSSTKGAIDNEYTAIVFLDNAEMLIRMATMQRPPGQQGGGGQQGGAGGMQPGGMPGMGGGLGNLELPGMMQ